MPSLGSSNNKSQGLATSARANVRRIDSARAAPAVCDGHPVALRVGALMQDVHVQYHQTRPWLLLAPSRTYSSSSMPQKANPGIIQNTRTLASDVVGSYGGVSKVVRMLLQSAILGVGAYLVIRNELTAGAMIGAVHNLTVRTWLLVLNTRAELSRRRDVLDQLR